MSTTSKKRQQAPLRVVCLIGAPFVFYDRYQKRYRGLFYELWQLIRRRLESRHGYTFEETFVDEHIAVADPNYLARHNYDLMCAPRTILHARLKYAAFTRPVMMSKHSVVYRTRYDWTSIIRQLFVKTFLPTIAIFLTCGAVLGGLLYLNNGDLADASITMSAIVGNHDYLRYRPTSKFGSMRWVTFVILLGMLLLVSTFTYTYLNGQITSSMMDLYADDKAAFDVKNKTILCQTGYAIDPMLKRNGARLVYKSAPLVDLVREVSAPTSEYDGLAISIFDAINLQSEGTGPNRMSISDSFGLAKVGFAMHPRYHEGTDFNTHMDRVIVNFISDFTIADLVPKYLGRKYKHIAII